MNDLKAELYNLCVNHVKNRIDTTTFAIKSAQQAANDETKSSAGDKYETGRAMMQQEINSNQAQLNEANKLMVALNHISSSAASQTADAGSLVITTNGKFYIAISAGTLTVKGETYFAVSAASPIGQKLKGQKAGSEFDLNGKIYKIQAVS